MKKRFLAFLLAATMVFAMMPTMAFAAAADHAIKLVLVKDTTTFGKDVLRVDFMYKSGTDTPVNQMVYLKFDASILGPLYDADGSDVSAALTSFATNFGESLTKNNYVTSGFGGGAAEVVVYAVVSGNDGYMCWKVTEKGTPAAFSDYERVSSVFFGLKGGTSFDAIPAGAIAYSDPNEDYAVTSAVQSAQIAANGGAVNLEYNKRDGSADTMTTAPVIVAGDGVTFAKEAITGTVAITASAKVGQKLTATVNGAPAGYTVTWYRGTTVIGTGMEYTTVAADIGAEITAKVTHNDYSGALTSNVAAVADKTLTALEITTPPTKVSYVEGQNFDPAGMVVKATYDNESVDNDFKNYEIVGGQNLAEGTTKVTISYNNGAVTVDQAITVVAKAITAIKVTTPPATTTYYVGDAALDTTGMVVTATYNDNSTAPVVGYEVSGFDASAASNAVTITVTKDGKTDTFTVKVVKKALSASDFNITIPAGKNYDGSAADAATVAAKAGVTGIGAITIKYGGSTTVPTNAGTYDVTVAVAEGTAYTALAETKVGTLTINKADVTLNASGASVKIGKTVTLTATGAPGAVKFTSQNTNIATVDENTGVVTGVAEGKAVIKITYPESANYNKAETTVEVTVNLLDPQKITADDVTATYGDTDKQVVGTSAQGGTISYAVKAGSEDFIDVNATTGALTIKKVGTAYVTVTAAATGDYAETTKDVTVTINPKAVTPVIGAIAAQDYTGAQIKPAVEVTADGNACEYDVSYGENINAGKGTVTVTLKGNYTGTATKEFDIKPIAQTIEIADTVTVTFNKEKALNATAQGAVTYEQKTTPPAGTTFDAATGTVNTENATAEGEFVVVVKAAATTNYTAATKEVTVKVVSKPDQTIEAADVEATYGDTNAKVEGKVTVGAGAVSYAVKAGSEEFIEVNATTGALTVKKAGTAYVVVTAAETEDYAETTKDVKVVIAPKAVTAPVASTKTYTYNGTEQTYAIAANAAYTVSGDKQTNAGTYTVTVTLVDTTNYKWSDDTTAPKTYEFKINKATVTITAASYQIKPNSELPDLTAASAYTVSGLAAGDTLTTEPTVAFASEPDVTKAGEYAITVSGAVVDTANYNDIVYVNGTMSIKNNIVVIPVAPKPDEDEPVEPEKPVVPVIGGVFTDVKADDWFAGAVEYVYENGLMDGMGNNQFAPYGTTTRGQIVTILWRLEGKPLPSITNPFSDVGYSEWYSTAITWAAEHKIVNGVTTTTFDPTAPITREQIAAILYRYAQYKGYDTSAAADLGTYADAASVSGYAVNAMKWACGTGLINGIDGALAPTGTAIRCQAATLLMRFCENVAK